MFYQYKLPNGIEVISEPMANRKTVALGVFVKVGSQDETKENNGISHLVEHMFFKGTETHSAKEIADITARMGDDVNAFTSKECTALYGMTITEKLGELAHLLGDLLTKPLFDAKELAKEKRIVMDEIDMYEDSPEDLVHELLQKRVWRDDALGFLISGTKSVVRRFHSEELHQFLREHYFAENILISAAGGYEEEELEKCLARAFANIQNRAEEDVCDVEKRVQKNGRERQKEQENSEWTNKEKISEASRKTARHPSPEATAVSLKREKGKELALSTYHKEYGRMEESVKTSGRKTTPKMMGSGQVADIKKATETSASPKYYRSFASADKEIEQLHLNLAFPALCVGDERRFAYSILNSAFGGSNNSRLFQKIREEAGMAYSVYSYSSAYQRAGLFHIDITVQPQLAVLVLGKVAEIVEEFARNGLTQEELCLHKQQVSTELIMSAESPKTRMDSNAKFLLAGTKIYTLEEKLAHIDAVDCGQISKLAGEILKLPAASLCVVGDKSSTDLRALRKMWEGWENIKTLTIN